jgi:hypothetical protein
MPGRSGVEEEGAGRSAKVPECREEVPKCRVPEEGNGGLAVGNRKEKAVGPRP